MRHLGDRKLAAVLGRHAVRARDDQLAPDGHRGQGNEVHQVIWEIGLHLAGFLVIVLAVNLLLVVFRVPLT